MATGCFEGGFLVQRPFHLSLTQNRISSLAQSQRPKRETGSLNINVLSLILSLCDLCSVRQRGASSLPEINISVKSCFFLKLVLISPPRGWWAQLACCFFSIQSLFRQPFWTRNQDMPVWESSVIKLKHQPLQYLSGGLLHWVWDQVFQLLEGEAFFCLLRWQEDYICSNSKTASTVTVAETKRGLQYLFPLFL